MSANTQSSGKVRRALSGVWLLSLAGLCLSILAPAEATAIWPFDGLFRRESLEERATKLLSDAIQIQTVNPPGNERALARRLAAELGRAGIKSKVVSTPSPDGGPERAAVWGRLEGSKGAKNRAALILLSHLDTVPANPADWSVDPFSGKVWDGFIWGRGALDAKGVAVTHLLTMVELANSKALLERDIIYLATPDEETGGQFGAGWIAKNHPELFEGAGYLLTEGGGIKGASGIDAKRPPLWGITLTEKAPCWLELRSRGRGGHSSTPRPDAAVPRLIAALDRIRRVESNVRVTDEVGRMFAALAPWAPEWDREGFSDLASALQVDEAFRRRFLDNAGQNALVRNTISITVLEGATKTNIAPALARAQLDARLLPGESCEEFATSIGSLIDEPSIEIEILLTFPSRASSADTPLYTAIAQVAEDQELPGIAVPRMIGGFTDAHWFRELGIVAYGFVPRSVAREDARRVHGIDERVRIDTLVRSIELMLEIIRTFDQVDEIDSTDES